MIATMERLRSVTRPEHLAIERCALAQAMFHGTMTRREYASQLAAYLRVHRALEAAVDRAGLELRALWEPRRRKSPLLESDLQHLDETPVNVDAVEDLVGFIEGTCPAELPGILYVFEGSTLGGTVLLPRIQAGLALAPEQSSFYRGYGDATSDMWCAFLERVNALVSDAATEDGCVAAAIETFVRLRRVFDALWEASRAS